MQRSLLRVLLPVLAAIVLCAPLAPQTASAADWHCDSCSCDCDTTDGTPGGSIPWPGDGPDPEGRCVNACRQHCLDTTGIATAFEGRGVGCSEVAAGGGTETDTNTNAPPGPRGGPAPTLPNPLGGSTDVRTIIGRVINAALGISGSVALLMFIWGGLQWLTSGGSPERIQKGKNTIVWAVLGLVLIFGSYAILNFVLGAILSAS